VAYPGNLFEGGGVQQIQLTVDRDLGAVAPYQGFWSTRNFVSYSKGFLIFDTLRLFMMTTNLFVIANVKQLRTGGSFRILLPFFPEHLGGVGIPNSAIFNSFHNRVEFGTILEGLRNFGWGG